MIKTIKKIFNNTKYLFSKQYEYYRSCRECIYCKRLENHKTIHVCAIRLARFKNIKKAIIIDDVSCKGCLYARRLLTFKDKINRLKNPYIITYPIPF